MSQHSNNLLMPVKKSLERISDLDGLRGMACLQVLLYHYVLAFWPKSGLWLLAPFNGQIAVCLFFLISGFVISRSYEKSDLLVWVAAIRRIVRLGGPTILSIVLGTILLFAGHADAERASVYAESISLHRCATDPTMKGFLLDISGISTLFGFKNLGPFNNPWLSSQSGSMNPPIWTISIEIWGSFLILVIIQLRRRSRNLYLWAVALSVMALGTCPLSLFLIGHSASKIAQSERLISFFAINSSAIFGIILLLLATISFAGDLPPAFLTTHGVLPTPSDFKPGNEMGAVFVFVAIMVMPAFKKILNMRLPQTLGRWSFSIYLLHFPIMVSLGSAVYLRALSLGPNVAPLLAIMVGGAITIFGATLFEKFCDRPIIALSKRLFSNPKLLK